MHALSPFRRVRRAGLALALACAASFAFAQAQKAPTVGYEPKSGQEGKDVVWVPTPQVLVDRMLDMAQVKPGEFVMDLGSGDGRTVISAAKRGARALGVEYNPDMVALSQRAAEKEGVAGRATFLKADLFETDFSRADVITMFLLPTINLKLRPKILELKPGTRIVSNSFDMGDWAADQTDTIPQEKGCNVSWCTALLWIVPAKVDPVQRLPQGEFRLVQQYQELSGTARMEGANHMVKGKLRGEEVTLSAGGKTWKGKVRAGRLELN
ncbi:MAG: class I SAM-dependent methyltransferase [Betaproteobacteria bacterium]|nr:class I SAM-dependent methyltransferase [Betaproteobacteria bacterium]